MGIYYTEDNRVELNSNGVMDMARPVKWRKVGFIPDNTYFTPCMNRGCTCNDNIKKIELKVEELEAIRLKDVEGLTQEECAQKMEISRQTFQNVIDAARRKVAIALVEGNAISIQGGHYTRNICRYKCTNCGNEFEKRFEDNIKQCNVCGSDAVKCRCQGTCSMGCNCHQ
ncbi:MAG: DUF134 domain-containing protein [Xylanivirga thermophila]|jgi:uncharacterized protein